MITTITKMPHIQKLTCMRTVLLKSFVNQVNYEPFIYKLALNLNEL